jgi:catechol 2,3-dioxygenase-like lactoylglutathione lyase family enzyme
LERISFEVSSHADFAGMAKTLSADGVRSEVRSDAIPGIGRVLAFDDPMGTTIELFTAWNYLGSHHQVFGAGPLKLGHIARVVENPKSMADFYCRVLGFRVSDWIEDYSVFLRCNPDHHTVNFIRGSRAKMHHIAFEMKDFAHIQWAGASRAWPQRGDLSSQLRRPEPRVLHRARPDEGRGTWLLRSPALASRHPAAAKDLGPQKRGQPLGATADA